jgi:hypothetical protein
LFNWLVWANTRQKKKDSLLLLYCKSIWTPKSQGPLNQLCVSVGYSSFKRKISQEL